MPENAMRFNDGGRALKVAQALRDRGYDVTWTPENPTLLFTSADREVARQIARETQGVVDEWWTYDKIAQKRITR